MERIGLASGKSQSREDCRVLAKPSDNKGKSPHSWHSYSVLQCFAVWCRFT